MARVHSLIAGMALTAVLSVSAQEWPSKPIVMIVPFPPGMVDNSARVVSDKVSRILGQPIVAVNRPGAGMRIGTTALLGAPNDGYTIGVLVQANGAITPALDPNAGYDPRKDLTLIALAYDRTSVLVVHPSTGIRSVGDLIKAAKAQPGKLNYGSGGVGTAFHLWFEVFKSVTGTDITHIPYKGLAQATQGLVAGQTHVMFTDSGAKPFMEAGRLFALATTGEKRSPAYPGVATIKETGIPFTASSWLGFAAPANLPKDVSQRLVGAFLQALEAPDVRAALAAIGNDEVVALGPSEFAAKIGGEIEKLKRVAEENKIRPD